jgi:hypothetical protein
MYFIREKTSSSAKRVVRKLNFIHQQATWKNRHLPDFIIIGAQKSGTTSLYSYLSQHPHLIPSYRKEVHFFDGGCNYNVDNFKKGRAWYQSQFPPKQNISNNQKAFEASPLYIFNPLAPKRISELLPEVKLIAVLRNPVDRAISHYFHAKRAGYEPLPIMEALQAEEERLKPIIEKQDYKNNIFIHYSYKKRGLYYEQLKRYLNYFPMSNILVINSENLFTELDSTLRRILKFVDIDTEYTINDLKPRNVGSNRTKVDPDVYEYLEDYFCSHNQELYNLMGQNYGW